MKGFKLNGVILAISLISVIGIMGVGYAEWKDDINILGHISTGKASIVLENDLSDNGEDIILRKTTTVFGEIKIPFTIINNGTVPMKLKQKTENIEFECNELLVDSKAKGFIKTTIGEDEEDDIKSVDGSIEMICLNGGWSERIDINAIVDVNIPKSHIAMVKDSEKQKEENEQNKQELQQENKQKQSQSVQILKGDSIDEVVTETEIEIEIESEEVQNITSQNNENNEVTTLEDNLDSGENN